MYFSWFTEIISLVELVHVSEFPKLTIGVLGTRPFEHLRIHPNPFVGDPFTAYHHWTASVTSSPVVASIFIHVPPDDHGAFLGFDESSNGGEYSIASEFHVTQVSHDLQRE